MNKQRLLELAGITEAKYSGSGFKDAWIVTVVNHGDVDQIEEVYGPFFNEREAYQIVGVGEELSRGLGPGWAGDQPFEWEVFKLSDPQSLEATWKERREYE
jgi:hypothetical protein